MAPAEAERVFHDYFAIFPWQRLPPNPQGFDMGCGSGRWARFVAPRASRLHCNDPSSALVVARRTLADQPNVLSHQTSVADSSLSLGSQDFGYSLGVLHHLPDTAAAIRSCSELLKPGAPLLLYLYYNLVTGLAGSAGSGSSLTLLGS
jgi:SAM-dependent methyltransferase